VKSSTATGTTATASRAYRGRFAPSPTGLLHQGSLVAALGSWLDARAHGGKWLVRMEDLDRARNVPGAADAILATLDSLGLVADEPVLWQSARTAAHARALEQLRASGAVYRCTCTRSDEPGIYSGHCRQHPPLPGPAAWRLKLDPGETIEFDDVLQGRCRYPAAGLGDPVIFRRDGVAAYQLAVVVDDAFQGITHVVRGADLLESTAWQIALGRALGLPEPVHAHLPLVVEADGAKLAKSRNAEAIARWPPGLALERTLGLLGYTTPDGLAAETVPRILDWAQSGWPPQGLAGRRTLALPA
jgi:glutamyl-Q tRNA(Asp) synthetase